ncbi:mitochondrial import inner membrane translocase subunit PAM16 like 2-like isoform X1 [Solanum stenotomum]|uniref:mitochondrial import inner membrane translocase subunit PAM16 like 2-like isoform X1 n=1 Tax=Solanum stenotomum TaxID=172797 RepID=UPI0020D032A0|nr:mitochondrial import inner membrane translocase subunit PAM16 like 2-like isoform X1 [Solanum stenotomum]
MCLLEMVSYFGNYTIMLFLRQAAKILANLIVMGSSILARAFVQAYRQALSNASKNGVAQEAVQNIKRASKTMTEAEARQILGVTEDSSWEEIVQVRLNVNRYLVTLLLSSI